MAKIVILLVLSTMLSACAAKKSSFKASSTEDSGADTAKNTRLNMQIVNSVSVTKIAADASGSPAFYAVFGELLTKDVALSRLLTGSTLCYAKYSNFIPGNGQVIRATFENVSKSEEGKTLQYMNINRTDDLTGASFGLVCMKLDFEVKTTDVRDALAGLMTLVQY